MKDQVGYRPDGGGVAGRARTLRRRWLAGAGCLVLGWVALAGGAAGQGMPPAATRLPRPLMAQVDKTAVKQPAKVGELPPPRPTGDPFAGRFRLPTLPGAPHCPPSKEQAAKDAEALKAYIADFIDPRTDIEVVIGRTRVMVLKETPRRIQIGDETIAGYQLLDQNNVALQGRSLGSTVLNLWFADPKDPNRDRVLSILIHVTPDPESRERLEKAYKALEKEINNAFPDSIICLNLVGEKLVLSGQAKDVVEAAQILRIVQANAPVPPGTQRGRGTVAGDPGILRTGLPAGERASPDDDERVVNLLRVPGEQQVMLRVTVAEIHRAAARSIGVNFNITNNQGITVFGQNTGNLFNQGIGGFGFGGGGFGAGAVGGSGFGGTGGLGGFGFGSIANNLPINLDGGQIPIALNALRNMDYARSLAEPNLVALNGQTATFQAGGQFPVPVVAGTTLTGLQGVTFIPYGVQLFFTPYITDKDRVRLTISAEVSTRDLGSGANFGGTGVPGLNTRNFTTTVELREGQTLAVAGLIQNNLGADSTRVPLLGDLPVFGRLWGFERTTSGEQELVILVTPELVHPMEPKDVPPLPGSDVFEPGDIEFYLLGRMESRRNYDYRAPVRTDIGRMAAYRHCEHTYIYGQHGYSDVPVRYKP